MGALMIRENLLGLNSNPKALWVKVVKALHGHEGGFGLNDNTSNGIWSKIVGSSNYLHSNDILPSDSIRLFYLELNKDCLISERFINNHWTWNWSRPILGTRNLAYLNDLINEINPIELSTDLDACIWTIANDGVFLLALLGITLTRIFCPLWIIILSGTKVFHIRIFGSSFVFGVTSCFPLLLHISTGKIGWVYGMRPKKSLVVIPLSLPPLSGGFGGIAIVTFLANIPLREVTSSIIFVLPPSFGFIIKAVRLVVGLIGSNFLCWLRVRD
ncbi:hypothetical protein Tco_1095035 [Tanacetum coccineum]